MAPVPRLPTAGSSNDKPSTACDKFRPFPSAPHSKDNVNLEDGEIKEGKASHIATLQTLNLIQQTLSLYFVSLVFLLPLLSIRIKTPAVRQRLFHTTQCLSLV